MISPRPPLYLSTFVISLIWGYIAYRVTNRLVENHLSRNGGFEDDG